MDGINWFLIVLVAAGCGGGGGVVGGGSGGGDGGGGGNGSGTHDDAGVHDGNNGSDGNGADASVPVATNDLCANALPMNLATAHVSVATNPASSTADLAAPCGTAGTPDVFFKFTLTRRELVYADTFGSSSNTTLFFATSCTTARTGSTTTGDAVCSTGACGTGQAQVAALLDPGTHYLVLAGNGAATIHFQHAEVGSGSVEHLGTGQTTHTGTTTSNGLLFACEAGGGESTYWWQACPNDTGGVFQASTCSGTDFDTILSFQVPSSESVLCNDDACGLHAALSASIPAGAGLFVLSVDGFSQARHGNFTLSASRP